MRRAVARFSVCAVGPLERPAHFLRSSFLHHRSARRTIVISNRCSHPVAPLGIILSGSPGPAAKDLRGGTRGVGNAALSLVWSQRAFYAKGGKGKKDEKNEGGPTVPIAELMAQTKESLNSQMKQSVEWLTTEFSKLRLGRANTELLDRVKVQGIPLAKKGTVYVKDSFTLAITPFDKDVR